jgi:hypothetical protein
MITCSAFRATLTPGSDDAAQLEHLRHCDACLDFAAGVDPDFLFRAIGGEDFVPPGGIDAFAADVMREVRLRERESTLVPHRVVSWPQRLAIAATIAAGVTGGALVWNREHRVPMPSTPVLKAAHSVTLATKPVVETYSSQNATIVEVPADSSDTQVVMVFDDKLPADL